MNRSSSLTSSGWGEGATEEGRSAPGCLLSVVDAGLCGVIFIAPYFFGGRHDVGRLMLVAIIAVTATAWFVRQAMLPAARWPRTTAHAVLLLTAAVLVLQVVPLPIEWLNYLSPRTMELLPLWTPSGNQSTELGTWRTISLYPHESTKSLAMFLSYSLLFVVVAGRIEEGADVERMLRWIAASAVLMAAFGIAHYFTSDGRYFWFYRHPYRSPTQSMAGAFINHNHFANFLVLGVGPLASWLLGIVRQRNEKRANYQHSPRQGGSLVPMLLAAALAIVLFAIFVSLSRGGILALVVALVVIGVLYTHSQFIDSKYLWSAVGLAAVVVGLLSLYGYEEVSRRLNTLTHGSMDRIDSNEGRRKIWVANVAAISAGGLLGSGAGSHRMIYPVYLPESLPYEYSHAENGYLQVVTETGFAGGALLLTGLLLGGAWSLSCLRHARSDAERLCFAAAAGGLAASVAHSIVDFVWYIPACMSVSIVLAACVLRLSQLALASDGSTGMRLLPRGRWVELSAASALVGAWTVHTFVGPAVASVYWDRYMLASASRMDLADQQWSDLIENRPESPNDSQVSLNQLMLRQLEQVIDWDPHFARARLRLAAKCVAEFELRQQNGQNRMTLAQIRDAALSSSFSSATELQSWLVSAFGSDVRLLRLAQAEARVAVTLCPLQGEGYLYLAELSFLAGNSDSRVDAYVDQGLRVRPHDADVLFEVGKQEMVAGNVAPAIEHWKQSFKDPGPQQLKIVYLLAGRIPAALFLSTFEPDWRTLRQIWSRYRVTNRPHDIESLLAYSSIATRRLVQEHGRIAPDVLLSQSTMFADVGRMEEALACLERAYSCDPSHYEARQALAHALADAGRFAESEPHFRWCLARRPADKSLSNALVNVSKARLAKRESQALRTRGTASWRDMLPTESSRHSPKPSIQTHP